MRFTPEIHTLEVEREFRRFLRWTGEEAWRAKIEKLRKSPQLSAQDLYRAYLFNKNPFLLPIGKYFSLVRDGKSVRRNVADDLAKAAGYFKVLNAIAHNADAEVQKKLKGSTFDDDGAAAFLFELDIAIHFLRLGYDVEFTDLEGKGHYDLRVSNGQRELEIECKRKSADAGRKIKRGDFYLLADMLFSHLTQLKMRFAILIRSEGRMAPNQRLFRELAENVVESLGVGKKGGQLGPLQFEIQELPQDLRINSDAEAVEALTPYGFGSAHLAVISKQDATFVIKCESTDRDKVLNAIYKEMKDGATQFSGMRPGLLACFIEDIDDDGWEKVRDKSGLQAMTIRLLSNPERSHVNFVTYSSDRTPARREGNVVSFAATRLGYWNPNPKFDLPKSFLDGR